MFKMYIIKVIKLPPIVSNNALVLSGERLNRPTLHPAILGMGGTNCLIEKVVPARAAS